MGELDVGAACGSCMGELHLGAAWWELDVGAGGGSWRWELEGELESKVELELEEEQGKVL